MNSEMLAARHRPVSRDVHVMRWSLRREAHAFRPADRFDGAGPHLVVVGGSVALGYGDEFFAAAQAELTERARIGFALGARILPVGLGDEGPLVGAAAVARRSAWHGAVR